MILLRKTKRYLVQEDEEKDKKETYLMKFRYLKVCT